MNGWLATDKLEINAQLTIDIAGSRDRIAAKLEAIHASPRVAGRQETP